MTNFKKFFGVMFIALMAVVGVGALSSCSSKADRLDKALEQLNQMLPMNLGNGFTMEKISLDDNALVYLVKCNENEIDLDLIEQNKAELKANTVAQLKSEKSRSKDFASLLEYCQEKDYKVIYRYEGATSKKDVDIVVSPDEI